MIRPMSQNKKLYRQCLLDIGFKSNQKLCYEFIFLPVIRYLSYTRYYIVYSVYYIHTCIKISNTVPKC